MNEWVGIGCIVRHDIHQYFLMIQMTRPYAEVIKRAFGCLEADNIRNAGTLVLGGKYTEEHDVFVIPTSEWKLVGMRAAMSMSTGTAVIRVSAEHVGFMRMSSIVGAEVDFEVQADSARVDFYAHVDKDYENSGHTFVAENVAPKAWVERWASLEEVRGEHGQSVEEAMRQPPPEVFECYDCGEDAIDVVNDLCPECRATCRACERVVSADSVDDGLCEDCVHACANCGEGFLDSELDDHGHCVTCQEDFDTCANCNGLRYKADMVEGHCLSCMVRCTRCGEQHVPSALNDDNLCSDCLLRTAACAGCGERFDADTLSEEGGCPACEERAAAVAAPTTPKRKKRRTRR